LILASKKNIERYWVLFWGGVKEEKKVLLDEKGFCKRRFFLKECLKNKKRGIRTHYQKILNVI
jgi:hypothetical protein